MPVYKNEEYPEFSHLDLMVAANFRRFLQWEDTSDSAFRARSVISMLLAFYALTILEIVIVSLSLIELRDITENYYILIIAGVWGSIYHFVYKNSLNKDLLQQVILYPEEFMEGKRLTLFHFILSLAVYGMFILSTKPN